jgi:4-hydroxybenzoate polyprenyltransferase
MTSQVRRPKSEAPGRPGPTGGGARLRACLDLLHPLQSGATVLAALGFALLFRPRPLDSRRRLLLLGAMVGAQQVAISLHNDWSDADLDRATKPWRAVPSGVAPAGAVRAAAWALAAVSLVLAVPGGRRLVLLDAAGTGAGFVYNARLKRTPWSWLPFALAFPLIPLFGAAALDAWPRRWWTLFLVGAPAVLVVHLSDAIPDLEGDARAGAGGLARRLGRDRATRLCLGALGGSALVGIALGLARGDRAALGWAGAALLLTSLAGIRPGTQRAAVPLGAAALGLGWVAAVAGDYPPPADAT